MTGSNETSGPVAGALMPRASDVAVAVGVAVLTLVCVFTVPWNTAATDVRPGDTVGTLVALGMTLPLAWRRVAPRWCLVIPFACAIASAAGPYATDPADLFLLFAVGSTAALTTRRTAMGLAAVGLVVQFLTWAPFGFDLSTVITAAALALVPPILGDLVRLQREHLADVEQRAARQARIHELERLRAAEAERLRIARELHDIVGHSLSAIGLQARAIGVLVEAQPERAREELARLADVATVALRDTRASVRALRDDDGVERAEDARLADLIDATRAHGGLVRVHAADLAVDDLPSTVQRCLYRVLQESLTNATRHGRPGGPVEVTLDREAHAVCLTVSNEVATARTTPDGSEHGAGIGLIGMTERVAAVGGALSVDDDAGCWRIRARIPRETISA